ncbi:DMT family transporter [Paradesulfitobacterium aromaticivorans]
MERKTRAIVPHLMLISVAFIFSTNFIVGKALTEFPPFFLGTARFLIASVIYLPFLLSRQVARPKKQVLGYLIVMGFSGIFLFNPLVYWGLHYTTSINATLINSFNPMTISLFSSLYLKEKLPLPNKLGLFVSFLGISCIVARGDLINFLTFQINPGDLLVVLSTFVWAAYTVLVRKTSAYVNSWHGTIFATYIGLAFLLPASLLESHWMPLPTMTLTTGLALIYLGLFPSVIAFMFWNSAVSRLGPARSSLYYNLIPIFSFLLASSLFGEKLRAYHLEGTLLILMGLSVPHLIKKYFRPQASAKDPKAFL